MKRIEFKPRKQDKFDEDPLPNVERDFKLAKRYLQKYGDDNETLWGVILEVIHRILVSKEDFSQRELHDLCRRIRENKMRRIDWIIDMYVEKEFLENSKILKELYTKPKYVWSWEERKKDNNPLIDEKFLVKMKMKKSIGFRLPDKEVFNILMSMRVLAETLVASKATFWGKIFGILRDYYIIECDVDPAELERMRLEEEEKIKEAQRLEEEAEQERKKLEAEENERLAKEEKARKEKEKREKTREKRREKERKRQEAIKKAELLKQKRIERAKKMGKLTGEVDEGQALGPEAEGPQEAKEEKPLEEPIEEPKVEEPPPPETLLSKYIMPKLPVSKPRLPTVEVPPEPYGEGLNKKIFFVCNSLGEPWVKLPDVTPQQIAISRKIKKFCTGDLESEIISEPPFPGKEKNYLRAIIARISGSTQISPTGCYLRIGEEEGGGGEGSAPGGEAAVNPDFPGIDWRKLYDKKKTHWVHHSPYILPQGRLTWWKPPVVRDEDEVGEAGEAEGPKPEHQLPILRIISRDRSDDVQPWSLTTNTTILNKGIAVMAKSNLWPGACNTVLEFNYQFMYIGWGIKFSKDSYNPPYVSVPKTEYETGPEILEMSDPTPEEEEAWRIAHMPKPKMPIIGEGGEGGEGDTKKVLDEVRGKGDDDDDDDD